MSKKARTIKMDPTIVSDMQKIREGLEVDFLLLSKKDPEETQREIKMLGIRCYINELPIPITEESA